MTRPSSVKSAIALLALGSLAMVAGCGGGGGTELRGEVSGVVFDQEGFVVRGARVFADGGSRDSTTTTAGTYSLSDVPATDVIIRAEITKAGVRYVGQNLASVVSGERARNVNVAVYPNNELATLRGQIRDRTGARLRGVRIFLRPTDSKLLTSAVGITDRNGDFNVGGLLGGKSYSVQVNGLGFNSDFDTITLNPRETRTLNFTVPDGTIVNVPAPANLVAVAYTSPPVVRSDAKLAQAMEYMRKRLRPQGTHVVSRTTTRGNPIEVDLFWDRIENTALLGFGIYRGQGTGALRNIGFLRDPQAEFYADLSDNVVEDVSYTYGVTSLDTLYDGTEGESSLSNTSTVVPLGDLILGSVTATTTPTFRWTRVNGATRYAVYLFTEYPSFNVPEIYTNQSSPVNSDQFTYDGPALTRGRTYYYIITAERADQSAISLSQVGSFTVG